MSDPLELEVQAVVSELPDVHADHGSSGRATITLNH